METTQITKKYEYSEKQSLVHGQEVLIKASGTETQKEAATYDVSAPAQAARGSEEAYACEEDV